VLHREAVLFVDEVCQASSAAAAVSFTPVRALPEVETRAGDGVEVVLASGKPIAVHTGVAGSLLRMRPRESRAGLFEIGRSYVVEVATVRPG
jgi:hypothetical protein